MQLHWALKIAPPWRFLVRATHCRMRHSLRARAGSLLPPFARRVRAKDLPHGSYRPEGPLRDLPGPVANGDKSGQPRPGSASTRTPLEDAPSGTKLGCYVVELHYECKITTLTEVHNFVIGEAGGWARYIGRIIRRLNGAGRYRPAWACRFGREIKGGDNARKRPGGRRMQARSCRFRRCALPSQLAASGCPGSRRADPASLKLRRGQPCPSSPPRRHRSCRSRDNSRTRKARLR